MLIIICLKYDMMIQFLNFSNQTIEAASIRKLILCSMKSKIEKHGIKKNNEMDKKK